MALRLSLITVVVTLMAGCGGTGGEGASRTKEGGTAPAAEAPAAQSGSEFSAPCGGMTVERAAEILGVAASEIEHRFAEELHTCSFRAGRANNLSYAVYMEADAATAEAEIDGVVEGLEFLGDCEPVDDLGDAAIYCGGDADRLLVRRGAVWIDLLSPTGPDDKRRAAEQILATG